MALVLLKHFDDPVAAQAARATLEAHEILAFLFEEHNPYPAYAMAPVRLMVSEDDIEVAAAPITDVPDGDGNDADPAMQG